MALLLLFALPAKADLVTPLKYLDGQNVEITPLTAAEKQSLLNQVGTVYGSTVKEQMKEMIENQGLDIGYLPSDLGYLGVHDFNTIGISRMWDVGLIQGVSLGHEFKHVLNIIQFGASAVGTDLSAKLPCGGLNHAAMNTDAAAKMCESLGPATTDDEINIVCKAIDEIRSAAVRLYNSSAQYQAVTAGSGCPGMGIPPPLQPEEIAPPCPECL